jgi:RNA polymerase sigma-70 factor (ECF subfamily)
MNEADLTRFYEEHVDGLYAFVFYRVGRDPTLAEDVVQETFTQALAEWERFDAARGSPRAWLCTLSRNVIRKHVRERPKLADVDSLWERIDRSLAEAFEAIDAQPLPIELMAREETRDLVSMTVANLPDSYRSVLERKYVSGESLAQLAEGLKVSEDAVKSLLARARKAFRETFLIMSRQLAEVRPAAGGQR